MSIRAMNWAMGARTDGVSAQCVLFVVADTANEHGVSIHADPDYIAERTRQSRATVFRRLKELEDAGALTRFKRYRDDGAPVYEVRLHLDRSIDYVSAPNDHGPQDIEPESQIETPPESQSETPKVAPVRQAESHSCDYKSPSKNPKEDSPLPPKGGDDGEPIGEVLEDQSWPGSETWFDFEKAWPDPIMRVSTCRGLWSALREDERLRAITAARGYAIWRKQQRRPPNYSAQTFLREPDGWPSFAKHAPPEPGSSAPQPRLIGANSREGMAIIALYEIAVTPPPYSEDRLSVLVSAVEIGPQVLALADAPPWREWIFTENANQSGAWAQLMRPIIGKTPRMTDRGVRVPWLWPPRVDGSIPKPHSISDQDADELSKTATGH